MRNVFAFFIGSVLVMSPALALAQETSGTDVPAPAPQASALPGKTLAEKRSARLDELFFALKRERNEAKATRIAEQIQAHGFTDLTR